MTGLLKDLMHDRADQAGRPQVDIDAIVADGDKRVRRRRVRVGAGVAAVAAVVALGAIVGPGLVDRGAEPVQPTPGPDFSLGPPTYALGSTIHYGDQAIDVSPRQVWNLAKADHGFVFLADDKHVYLADGTGAPKDLGRSGEDVVADGPYVGYVSTSGDTPAVVAYNTASGREVLRTSAGVGPGAQKADASRVTVLALDGSQLYWHNSQGVVVSDLTSPTDDPIVLQPHASTLWLQDVAQGVLARYSFDDITTTVSRDTDATQPNFEGDTATLSPDASHVATVLRDDLRVYDVGSGRNVTPTRPTFAQTRFVNWLDGTTFAMAGADSYGGSATLLTCDIRTRACQTAATDVGVFGELITR